MVVVVVVVVGLLFICCFTWCVDCRLLVLIVGLWLFRS